MVFPDKIEDILEKKVTIVTQIIHPLQLSEISSVLHKIFKISVLLGVLYLKSVSY